MICNPGAKPVYAVAHTDQPRKPALLDKYNQYVIDITQPNIWFDLPVLINEFKRSIGKNF
jgi:hypothetical protein